jgi:hypothetical protein
MASTVNAKVVQNGVNLTSATASVIMLGLARPGVKMIAYNFERASANTYGMGAQPFSFGYGQVTYTGGSIEFIADELNTLVTASGGDITAIPAFSIKIAHTPDVMNPLAWTETLTNVRIKGRTQNLKGGDTSVTQTVAFEYAGIEFNQ